MSVHPSFFRCIHEGERAWLLGNGPSLLEWRLEELRELGGVVVGMNKSWRGRKANQHGPEHPGFQGADYHCLVAGDNVDDLAAGKIDVGTCAFVPSDLSFAMEKPEVAYSGNWCAVPRGPGRFTPGKFRLDLELGFDATFAGYFALQLAAYMGFREIFLLGYDCLDREGHHWDDDPAKGIITRHQMLPWFHAASEWAEASGVEIVNCCERSAIPYFRKIGKEEVLSCSSA